MRATGCVTGLSCAAPGRPTSATSFDLATVVAVCDHAYEELAETGATQLHWSIPDPARSPTDDAIEHAFIALDERVDRLAGTLAGPDQSRRN